MTEPRFRCSVASEERGEPLAATASTVAFFLLLEEPGPWGPALLRSRRLPEAVRRACVSWERELRLRPLLIRRPGRTGDGPRRIFVVNARRGWVQTTVLPSLAGVVDLNVDAVASAGGAGLDAHPDPLVLACTHGRHDACCAERGRPLAGALADEFGELVWESSHLGGDRFAGNVLVLPGGHLYGRLDPASAVRVVTDHLAGYVTVPHYRGRTTVPWVAQFAEHAVRERLGLRGVAEVSSRVVARTHGRAVVEVTAAGAVTRVAVEVGEEDEALLTCQSVRPGRAPRYTLR